MKLGRQLAHAIEELIDRKLDVFARNRLPTTKYGVIAGPPDPTARKVAVFLDGQAEPSAGFSYSGWTPVEGTFVRLHMGPRGDRYIDAPLQDASPTFYNVRDYGALGDDVHEDSGPFQAAADAANAAGGGVVYVPTGIYRISKQIAFGVTTSLIGEAAGHLAPVSGVTIRTSTGADSALLWLGAGSAPGNNWGWLFRVENIEIVHTGSGAALRIERCTSFSLANMTIRGPGSATGNGLEIIDSYSGSIYNCRSTYFASGASIYVQSTGLTQPGSIIFDNVATDGSGTGTGFAFVSSGGVMDSIILRACIATACSVGVSITGTGGNRLYRIENIHIESGDNTSASTGIFQSGSDATGLEIDGVFAWGLQTPINITGAVDGLLIERIYANSNAHVAPAGFVVTVSSATARAVEIGNIRNNGYAALISDVSEATTRRHKFAGSVPDVFAANATLTLTTAQQDVSGASMTATPTLTERWIIVVTFDINITVAGAGLVQGLINFDAATVGGSTLFDPNNGVGRATVGSTHVITGVTPGVAHTVKLRSFKTNAGGTAAVQVTHTRMVVYRVPE